MPNPARRTDPRYRAGRTGKAFELRKQQVYATETECHARICLCPTGRYVDQSLPHRDPATGRINIWSRTFGHTDELDRPYTNPLEGHLEHWRCNTSAGASYGNRKRAGTLQDGPGVDTSYDWS